MRMRKLNFYLTSSAENMTKFSLYKRKIVNPPSLPTLPKTLLACMFCLPKPPSLIDFSQKILACLLKNKGVYIGGLYMRLFCT